MTVMLRTVAPAVLVLLLASCGDSAPDAASAGSGEGARSTSPALVPLDELLAQANAALQDKRLFDPAEGNAMALFLEVSQRTDTVDDSNRRRRLTESVGAGDPQQQARLAMNDLMPFGIARVEQALRASELVDAGRILALLERAQPDSAALKRLRDNFAAAHEAARRAFRSTEPERLPQLLSKSPPRYPPRAERRGVEGWVHLTYAIEPDGSVSDVVVVDSEPRGVFDQEAAGALKRWRYAETGRQTRAQQRMVFSLDGEGD